jgi:hypothetical protein
VKPEGEARTGIIFTFTVISRTSNGVYIYIDQSLLRKDIHRTKPSFYIILHENEAEYNKE